MCGKRVIVIEVPWKRGEEVRIASGWITSGTTCRRDLDMSGDETQCRINWKRLIRNIDPT